MLFLVALISIFLLFFLVIKTKLHAFVALLLIALLLGVLTGMPLSSVINSIEKGMGSTLGFVATVVGLGAMFGQIMEVSGGAEQLARTLLRKLGEKHAPWALGITGFLIAIPVFFDVGFIILVPIIYRLTRKTKKSILYYGIPLLAGLAVAHSYIPPTPGPLAVADLMGVNIGWVIIYGSLAGIPSMIIAGPIFGKYIAKKIHVDVPQYIHIEEKEMDEKTLPHIALVMSLLFIPIILILLNTISSALLPQNSHLRDILTFIGHPFTALIITTLLSFYFLGIRQGYSSQQIQNIANKALEPAGIIILVTGAGGAFKQVLIDSGVGNVIGHTMHESPLPPIIIAFIVAALVRLAQGSSTVAMITAGGLISPVIHNWHLSSPELGLIVISIASGATILSHVNDSGFWLINRYFGLSIPETLRSWTIMETLISLVGLAMVCLLSLTVS